MDAAEEVLYLAVSNSKRYKPEARKERCVFLQVSEGISTPWGLVCGYYLASSLASKPTGRVAREKVGPRSDSLGRQLMWLAG